MKAIELKNKLEEMIRDRPNTDIEILISFDFRIGGNKLCQKKQ